MKKNQTFCLHVGGCNSSHTFAHVIIIKHYLSKRPFLLWGQWPKVMEERCLNTLWMLIAFKFNSRIASLSSYLSDNVDVLEQLNHNLYKQGIISNEEREEVLKTPLGNEKALSLTKAIETALTRSPESLPTVIEELRKFEDLNDIIDSMTIPQVTDEGQYVYMYYNNGGYC